MTGAELRERDGDFGPTVQHCGECQFHVVSYYRVQGDEGYKHDCAHADGQVFIGYNDTTPSWCPALLAAQPEDVGEPLTREDYGDLIGACQQRARHAMRVAKISYDESDLDIVEKWDRLADKCESRMDELPAPPTRHPTKEAENG
jgi:hypothetical protein